MDELELLKKDWQANCTQADQYISSETIYSMLHKKSSSIVKMLLYISIAELLFWIVLNLYPLFASEQYRQDLALMYGSSTTILVITILSSVVMIVFVYLLFKSYQSISVTDSAKKLMENILKTRKIIKYYVIYSLVILFITIIIALYFTIYENPNIAPQFANYSGQKMFIVAVFLTIFVAVLLLVFWVIYRLIYGILLRRLNKNYKELKRMEV